MPQQIKNNILTVFLLVTLLSNSTVRAQPIHDDSPYDLINAVNALRAAYGLPAYSINSILMFTAQNQADFMAATGNVTHTGAGGSSFTQRLLAAAYPLAGDLAAGGFRSENIISGSGMSAQAAIDAWMGDAPHQNTMLSQDLTEIGAGVAVVDGRVFYVIDCARPTTSGAPQASTPVIVGGATVPAGGAVVYPVVLSTPNAGGDVIHAVQSGQTLWQIAISYGVKIDDIKRLNYIVDNNIYPGDNLLIKKEATLTVEPPTVVAMIESTATLEPLATSTLMQIVTGTPVPVTSAPQNNNAIMTVALLIIALAVLGGGVFTWFGASKNDKG